MLAKLKADLAACEAYVVAHYKQLAAAVLAGHLGVLSALVAAVRHLLGL